MPVGTNGGDALRRSLIVWDILDFSVVMRMCLVGSIMDMWRGPYDCPICGGTFLLVSIVMNVIFMV